MLSLSDIKIKNKKKVRGTVICAQTAWEEILGAICRWGPSGPSASPAASAPAEA